MPLTPTSIDNFIDQGRDQLNKELASVLSDVQKKINKLITSFPSTSNGYVLTDDENYQYYTRLYSEMKTALAESGYSDVVTKAIVSEKGSIKILKDAYAGTGFPLNFTPLDKTYLNEFNKLFSDNLMLIPENAIESLRAVTLRLSTGIIDIDTAIEQAQKELVDKTQRYAETYIETARGQLLQRLQDWSAKNYSEEGELIFWEYVGPNDNKTRDECVWALHKQVFTDAEKKEFMSGGGFPHNEPRWNCRHSFIQITEKRFDKKENKE